MGAQGVAYRRSASPIPPRASAWRLCAYSVAVVFRRLSSTPLVVFVAINQRARTIEARARLPMSLCDTVGTFANGISYDEFLEQVEFSARAFAKKLALPLEPDDQSHHWRTWAVGGSTSPPPCADQRAARAA